MLAGDRGRTAPCRACCRSWSSRRPSRRSGGRRGRWRCRSSSRCSQSLCRNRTTLAPWPAATIAPSKIVLCARPSRKIVPSPTSTGITDMWMWVMVGRTRVSSRTEQLGQLLLDLRVQPRVAQQPGPGRVRAPPRQVLGHRGDDLLVEVEPQVVAGRPVGEPSDRRSGSCRPRCSSMTASIIGWVRLRRVRSEVAATQRSSQPSTSRRRGLPFGDGFAGRSDSRRSAPSVVRRRGKSLRWGSIVRSPSVRT